ncbi:MAG TPA: NTP transferase domain-containing protein [Candidatus Cybelea sp.]
MAAGNARRMGFDKAVRRCGRSAPLERVALALGVRNSILVVAPRLRETACRMMPRSLVLVNEVPQRGMAHSLRVALRFIPRNEAVGVLLGDMPAMNDATIARTELLLCDGVDVAFPRNAGGVPGHPVLFAPSTRAKLEALPDGDTLRLARDDPSFVRAEWTCPDASAFLDLDYPAQWEAFANA